MSQPRDVIDLQPSPSAPLSAGTYGQAGFVPPVTLTITEATAGSWFAVQSFDGFFDVQQGVGTPDVIAVQFARVAAVFGAAAGGAAAGGAPTASSAAMPPSSPAASPLVSAADAIEILRANHGLEVLEASPAVMAGRTGHGLTVDHTGAAAFSPVLAAPAGPISIVPGRRLWIGFFDTAEGLLTIMVGGSIARWSEAVTAAQPILASVTIAD